MTEPAPAPAASVGVTPMMAQYLAAKAAHPDCLLMWRMGDFYEMFFEDAVKAAGALDIALTKRGRHAGDEIPMCGVPWHSHETYLARLIRKGFRVALAEQTEDPAEAKKRGGGKTLVERAVVRIVTPGTLTEDALLEPHSANLLAAVAEAGGSAAVGCVDLSTGQVTVEPCAVAEVPIVLARLDPAELLLPERLLQQPAWFELLGELRERLTPLADSRFQPRAAEARLLEQYGIATLDGFGSFERAEIAALGALVDYLLLTQQGQRPQLSPPQRLSRGAALAIDAATRRSLELTRTQSGERQGSLLHVLDATVSAGGARLLAAWVAAPSTERELIERRLDAVALLKDEDEWRRHLRGLLKAVPDLERALSRLALQRGGPRDLAAVRDAVAGAGAIAACLSEDGCPRLDGPLPALLAEARAALLGHGVLQERLGRALADSLPLLARDGGFIAPGYLAELDEQRELKDDSRRLIARLEADYQREAGIATLRIKHNAVLGYFIEVGTGPGEKLLKRDDRLFIHRQTMASAMRFTTPALSDLQSRVVAAADRALAVELQLFADLAAEVQQRLEPLGRCAAALAAIDTAAALAEVAERGNWCRPQLTDGLDFDIRGGRHPVVADALERSGEAFVANDCCMEDAGRLWLLTGPNMAGKSTFLRQNALIALLAQTGSFVPAGSARIGIVDRLFSRVGAADDLARGRSTFMVEMVETATILNRATRRSLVILDEIGRGTATYDGVSIAWAAVEHLHDVNRCRGLFATHYHELTSLAARLPQLCCHTVAVQEWQGKVVFLHEVRAGTADRSYGIHVARLAGLPARVTQRAEAVLAQLEKYASGSSLLSLDIDLPLFASAAPPEVEAAALPPPPPLDAGAEPLLEALQALDPDRLSPREALDALYALKALANP